MQQEAARKLGFTAQRTMQAAQKLYEGVDDQGGLITYMRTDGLFVSPEGIAQARDVIKDRFGPAYVPAEPNTTKPKPKMLKKRTKRSGRPISPGIPIACASIATCNASMS